MERFSVMDSGLHKKILSKQVVLYKLLKCKKTFDIQRKTRYNMFKFIRESGILFWIRE